MRLLKRKTRNKTTTRNQKRFVQNRQQKLTAAKIQAATKSQQNFIQKSFSLLSRAIFCVRTVDKNARAKSVAPGKQTQQSGAVDKKRAKFFECEKFFETKNMLANCAKPCAGLVCKRFGQRQSVSARAIAPRAFGLQNVKKRRYAKRFLQSFSRRGLVDNCLFFAV